MRVLVVFYGIYKGLGVLNGNIGQNAVTEVDDVAVFSEGVDHLTHVGFDARHGR